MTKLYNVETEDRHTTLYENGDYVDLSIKAFGTQNNELAANNAKKKQLKGDVCTFVVRSLCGAPVISVLPASA